MVVSVCHELRYGWRVGPTVVEIVKVIDGGTERYSLQAISITVLNIMCLGYT